MYRYKHIKPIYEFRGELEIPFDGKHPLHDKPDHVHVVDILQHMAKRFVPVEKYTSKYTKYSIQKLCEDNTRGAFELYKEGIDVDDCDKNYILYNSFLHEYRSPIDNPECYIDEVAKYIDEISDNRREIEILHDVISHFKMDERLTEYLSIKGRADLESDEFLYQFFLNMLTEDDDIEWILKESINENGMIPIYRALNYNSDNGVDIFDSTTKRYKGVGVYWTYDPDKAEPYNGEVGKTYILHALVSPEHIAWAETIYKSAYDLRDEKEIELNANGEVLVYKVMDENENEYNIKHPMVIKTI